MVELKPGQLVRSLAGRDKGKHYLVLRETSPVYVLLVDGRSRPVDRPKKKNKAHLQHYERKADLGEPPEVDTLNDSQVIRCLKELIPLIEAPAEEV
ncbi:MAG: KOW domain-containing RNA-binding protein [Clostridia bacterium]|nr:KOW domain-containing RNA-binding protein [Clostridia bacterium]